MSLILIIDTSTEHASIALAKGGETIYVSKNHEQRDHAGWIHQAIQEGVLASQHQVNQLKAIAVTSGPGSYTGLRVGMATAKGLCYALSIPLISINTLEAMTYAVLSEQADIYCPLIDARRMEVYTALYDKKMNTILTPTAMILNEHSFQDELKNQEVLFFGSGSTKLKLIQTHPHAKFSDSAFEVSLLSPVITKKYNLFEFEQLSYSEPTYVKEVYINPLNKS